MDERLAKIIEYSQSVLADDRTGHDFDHAKRVASWVSKIIHEDHLRVNEFVALSAAYLHDTVDDKVVPNVEQARKDLAVFLTAHVSELECTDIFQIIDTISYSANLEHLQTLSDEGKIVQDADRLDALGAQGILRTAYYGGSHGHPIYDEKIAIQTYTDKTNYRKGSTVINHFYEKLFLLSDKMNTTSGKKEAEKRVLFMKDFLKQFYQEMSIELYKG